MTTSDVSAPIVHLELHTGDLPAAQALYTELCGWPTQHVAAGNGSYLALEFGTGFGGGIVECATQRPLWLPYAEVADIGAATERARTLGARILLEPREGPARLAQRGRYIDGSGTRLLAAKALKVRRSDESQPPPWSLPVEAMSTEKELNITDRNRWIALYVLCVGVLMIVLDVTVVNVALPSMQDDLGFSQSNLAWVVNAYLIAFGGLLLLAGRFGDLIGRKRIFMVGLAVFTAASVLCGLAQSQEMLVGARFVQGIGGAMTTAVTLGMIVTMFPEPREQAKAIGVYAFVASAGGSVGLLAGGVLTESINWHWIFFINIPIGIATALFAQRLIERDEGIGLGEGADVPGALLITSSLMLGVYTIVKPAADHGWAYSETIVLSVISLALLIGFVVREATVRNPLVPLRIFRSRNVAGANIVQPLSVAGMFGMFFLGSLYLERVLGYSALEIGLAFLPATIIMGTMSIRYSEPLIMRFGAKTLLIPGLSLIAAGLMLFTRAPVDGNYVEHLLPVMILFGFGAGLSFPALMTLAMSGATKADAGLASGLVNTSAQVGGALGLAVLATLSSTRTDNLIDSGEGGAAALTSGYHLAFWIGAALVGAAIAVAVAVFEPEDRQERVAAEQPPREEAYSEAA